MSNDRSILTSFSRDFPFGLYSMTRDRENTILIKTIQSAELVVPDSGALAHGVSPCLLISLAVDRRITLFSPRENNAPNTAQMNVRFQFLLLPYASTFQRMRQNVWPWNVG